MPDKPDKPYNLEQRRHSRVVIFPDLEPQFGIGYSRSWIWRLEKQGAWPKRIALGPNSVGWLRTEIEAWLAARIAERDGAAA